MAAPIKWTAEEDEFIQNNSDRYGPIEMSKKLESRFGVYRSRNAITNHCKILGITLINPKRHQWTEEQVEWVRTHARSYTKKELVRLFRERFAVDITFHSLEHLYNRYDILPENRGLHMTAGERNPFTQKRPIGAECKSGGKIYVKVGNSVISGGEHSYKDGGNWIEKKRYIYEQHFGMIPENYGVIHLDGNKENFDPENLYAVSRRVNILMSANNWWSEDPILTLTAIKWCELFYVLRKMQEKGETE